MVADKSRLKFQYKVSRAFGVPYEKTKEEFIGTIGDRWAGAVRPYFDEWDRVKMVYGARIPKLQRVLYRAMVFEAIRAVKNMDVDPEVIIEKYTALGADRALAEEILRFLGLYEAKVTKEGAT